jgi:HAE1 family hydrophobic/amphiphilic exporter-1
LYLDIDREKMYKLGVSLKDLLDTMSGYVGASYVNDFNKFGQVFDVMVQAKGEFRRSISEMLGMYVQNKNGEMVPIDTLVSVRTVFGPQVVNRYNMYQSAIISANAKPGFSSGQVMKAMADAAKTTLPQGFKHEWTDMSYQQALAGGQVYLVFVLALLFIYLFLVGQYESWMIPISVMLSVPVAFLGSLAMLSFMGVENNIYTQVGFILLFGMSCKTAILMVEFAKVRREQGAGIIESAITAGKIRFRAVVMTAFAFILGVLPLVFANGAGAASRRSLGTAVFGGMLAAALLGTVMVPFFYVAVQNLSERFFPKHPKGHGEK